MEPEDREAASALLEAIVRVAADPEGWDEIAELLERPPGAPIDGPAAEQALRESLALAAGPSRATPHPAAPAPAVAVLDLSLKVGEASERALAALSACGGRIAPDGRLAFDDEANREALGTALARLRRDAHDRVAVRLTDAEGLAPRFAFVEAVGGTPFRARLIFPPLRPEAEAQRLLQASFGLTAAESRLVGRLGRGLPLADTATALGVSVHTVRNQLTSVFGKIGVQRQSDLVRLMAELATTPPEAARVPGGDQARLRLPDGRTLAFREYGVRGGRAVIVFHDGLGSALLPPETETLAPALGLRVIATARPGFGDSSPLPGYGLADVAADVIALSDHLDLEAVTLLGGFSGAPFALAAAEALGTRARAVHLLSGRPPGPTSPGHGALRAYRVNLERNPWLAEAFFGILALRVSEPVVRQAIRRGTRRSPGDRAYADANPWLTDFMTTYMREALRQGGGAVAQDLRALVRGPAPDLARIAAPITIWHGENDGMAALDDLLAYVGGHPCRLRRVPGIGHLLAFKHWGDILRDVAA